MVSRVLVRWLFAAHEGFEAADLFAGTEDDKGIAGVDLVPGRGGGVEPALRGADGEDHGTGLLPYLQLADGVVGQGRLLRYAELFEPELEALLAAGDDVEEIHYEGLGRQRSEPASADGVGREGPVRAGYLQLGRRLVRGGTGDDVEAGVELSGREHDEDVVGVRIDGGNETLSALEARLFEYGVV